MDKVFPLPMGIEMMGANVLLVAFICCVLNYLLINLSLIDVQICVNRLSNMVLGN